MYEMVGFARYVGEKVLPDRCPTKENSQTVLGARPVTDDLGSIRRRKLSRRPFALREVKPQTVLAWAGDRKSVV